MSVDVDASCKKDELIFSGHLHIISRFQLSIFHMVLFIRMNVASRSVFEKLLRSPNISWCCLYFSMRGKKFANLFHWFFQGTAARAGTLRSGTSFVFSISSVSESTCFSSSSAKTSNCSGTTSSVDMGPSSKPSA